MQFAIAIFDLRRRSRRWGYFAALLLSVFVAISTVTGVAAHAAFPGRDDRIVYMNTIGCGDVWRNGIFTILPNGTSRQRLTDRGDSDSPDWALSGEE
jgi:hypothetical protein